MNYISNLNSLINSLKREYLILFSNFIHNNNNNNRIYLSKTQISNSQIKITFLLKTISTEISNLKNKIFYLKNLNLKIKNKHILI